MASNSTYHDHDSDSTVTFWDHTAGLDKDKLRIELRGDYCDIPVKLLRQLVCEHDYQVVDRTKLLMSNPPRYPTECVKCGSTSSISSTKADVPKLKACAHALDGVIYTSCPRTIHASPNPYAAPCDDCIDPLGGRALVDKITPRPSCKTCGTYLDCHGDECTYDYSGGA
jgi:hypothetical protein